MSALVPLSKYLIVSPGSVHLSYFTSKAFSGLSDSLGLDFFEARLKDLVDSLSYQSFLKLSGNIQKENSIAVFSQEMPMLNRTGYVEESSHATVSFTPSGIKRYYRPARFGSTSDFPLDKACKEIFY